MRDSHLEYLRSELRMADQRLSLIRMEMEGARRRREDAIAADCSPDFLTRLVSLNTSTVATLFEAEQKNLENRKTWERLIAEHLESTGQGSAARRVRKGVA
jgi:hypothetical protein